MSTLKILKLSDLPASTYCPRFAVLVDKLPDEITAFARQNPSVFVFTVLTVLPAPGVDYNALDVSGYILKPLYVVDYCSYCPIDLGRHIAAQVLGDDAVEVSA